MELVREYSSVSCFPLGLFFSCFFHIKQEYYGLSSSRKKLFFSKEQQVEQLDLSREYLKILYFGGNPEYLAYTYIRPKNELMIYYLDHNLNEFDIRKLRTEGNSGVEDVWLDRKEHLLYFIFPLHVQIYNLNGDSLGTFMKAPADTWYKAICTDVNTIYLAYEQLGSSYVAEYNHGGVFKDKFSVGNSFDIGNMEFYDTEEGRHLNLYGRRKGQIYVCLELKTGYRTKQNDICVELCKGDGIGDTTCFFS